MLLHLRLEATLEDLVMKTSFCKPESTFSMNTISGWGKYIDKKTDGTAAKCFLSRIIA